MVLIMEIIMAATKEKFATQVNSQTLVQIRKIATNEGRQLQAIIDEALNDLIEKRNLSKPRNHVMNSYQSSHNKYGDLYKKLAQ